MVACPSCLTWGIPEPILRSSSPGTQKKRALRGWGQSLPTMLRTCPDESLFHYFAAMIDSVNEEEFPFFVYNNAHYSQNTISPEAPRAPRRPRPARVQGQLV